MVVLQFKTIFRKSLLIDKGKRVKTTNVNTPLINSKNSILLGDKMTSDKHFFVEYIFLIFSISTDCRNAVEAFTEIDKKLLTIKPATIGALFVTQKSILF